MAAWSQTSHWGEWWTRLPRLQMLTQVFSHQYADWHGIPRNTIANGVERINQDSKQENPTSLHGTSDKAKALAAEKQSSMTYRSQTEESRHKSATSWKHQREKQMAMDSDQDAQLGPQGRRHRGTAGTAMAVPVFEEEKWRCWDSDLRMRSYILAP